MRVAAAEARGRGVAEAAVTYLRRALLEPPAKEERPAVNRELGNALIHADDPEGIEVLLGVRNAIDDPIERARIAAELSSPLALRRPGSEGAVLLEESLREIAGHGTPELVDLLRGHLVMQAVVGLEHVPAAVATESESWPQGAGMEGRFLLRMLAHLYAVGFGGSQDVEELVARAGGDLELYAEDVRAGLPAFFVFVAHALIDRGDLAVEPLELAMEVSKQRGTAASVAWAYGMRAICSYFDGDLDSAQADIEIILRFVLPLGLPTPLSTWIGIAVKIAVAQGELETAKRLLDDAWRGRDPVRGLAGASMLITRGELRAAAGRHAEARHDFIAARDRVRWLPYPNPEILGWRTGLALAEDALGNGEEARRLATEAVRVAREAGSVRGIGLTVHVLGSVTPGDEGVELLREAVNTLAGTRARQLHANALVDLGAALRRANHRKEAREPLRAGLDLAHRCGATGLEKRAHTELEATGARPRKVVLTGVESLTPSELRIAHLAAQGKSNREIAHSLFVTPKTVETHLRHIYQKLDVKRSDLGAALDVNRGTA